MRVGLCLIILSYLLCPSIYSQNIHSKQSYSKLDSLLLYNRIEEFLDAYENSIGAQTLGDRDERSDFYRKTVIKINNLQLITPIKSTLYIKTYSKLDTAFTLENAGSLANEAFQEFLGYLSEKDTISALAQVNIAFCFRERYIKDKRIEILDLYDKANFHLDKDYPDSALIMLKKYYDQINPVKSLSYIKDSLRVKSYLLRVKALERLIELRQMKNRIVSEKFQISYSLGINFSPKINNSDWPYTGRFDPKYLLVKTGGLNNHFERQNKFSFGYFVFKKLSAAIEYDFGKLRYSNPGIVEGFVSKDTYTARNTIYSFVVNYYFNNRVGFRQFAGIGFGYADFDLKINETEKYVPEYYYNIFELDTTQMKQHTNLLSLRLGADYLLRKPNFIFGISLNYTRMIKDIFYINRNIFKLSIGIGYYF